MFRSPTTYSENEAFMTNYVDVSSFPRQLPLRVRVGAYKLHGGCHSRISCRLQAVESMLWSTVMAGGSYYEDQVDNLLRATIILQQFCRKRWWSCLVTGRTSEAVFAGHTVFLHDTDELSDWAIGRACSSLLYSVGKIRQQKAI